jgi:rubrerythrin
LLAREPGIDLVLTDYAMPGMNGLELLQKIRYNHTRMPVVLVTAYGDEAMLDDAKEHHCNGFLNKPFSLEALLEEIANRKNAQNLKKRSETMNFNSMEEILEFAIEREKQAVLFYEDLAQQETFKAAKQIFEEYADEERKHQRMLEQFSQKKEALSRYRYKWIPDMKRSNYMVDIEYEPGMSYVDILRLAMKREEKALKLYNELATKTEDNDAMKLFQVLAQEEAKHKSYFERTYDDYMAEQGD